jgi:hypothetical protein
MGVESIPPKKFVTEHGPEQKESYGITDLETKLMGGISIDDISQKSMEWCVAMWSVVVGLAEKKILAEEALKDADRYYNRLKSAIEKRIIELGGKITPMNSIELP